jgi:translocation and assembly module TamB
MVLRDVEVRDAQGAFLTIPSLTIDWRPFAYIHSKIDVREFTAPTMTFVRKPAFKPVPSDPNAPILPDIDLSLRKLEVDRLFILPAVTGQRHVVSLKGSAEIADGRAQIDADAGALRAAGISGGDRLHVKLDAVPAANRFGLDARLDAPAGGLVDSYAKLGKPLTLTVDGKGDWANWHGAANGLLGSDKLAGLDVTGRNGAFHAKGAIRPGLILTGPAARLTEPAIDLDVTAKLADRKVDTRLSARSSALAPASGLIDLGGARLGNVQLDGQLLTPGAIAPNVRGRDVRLTAVMDGPFATPTIDYRLSAASLGFGTTGITGLLASGKATINTDRILVPVHATARAVTGVNAAAGGLLTNLRVDGDLAYQNGKLATDNLRLRSSRIDATAILIADHRQGHVHRCAQGRVNDYEVNGLGRLNLITDARLVPGINGGFAVRGRVRVVTRQLTNASVREQLGGNAVITADVGYDLAGGATVRNLRLSAPKFRITQGQGSYSPNGRIAFHAAGQSTAYGPLLLDVSGTVAKPVARLRAARPGFGVGLANVDATLEGSAAGYRVRGKGQSDYGPFAADLLIRTGRGPMSFDISSATFAGINFAGHLVQTPAGPFAGTLTLAGSGLNGSIRLAAAGNVQQADVDVRASAARIPGPAQITIGNGTIHATALLTPGAPSVTGQFALGDVRQGTLTIQRAQGRLNYRNGDGTVALVARGGQAGAPFDIAMQARLSADRVLANLRGTINGIAVRLAEPADDHQGRWRMDARAGQDHPAAGRSRCEREFWGHHQRTCRVAEPRSLDRQRLRAGARPWRQGDRHGRLCVARHGARSEGADRYCRLHAHRLAHRIRAGRYRAARHAQRGNGGDARALVKRGGAIVGRMQAKLAPLGAGAGLTQRLMAAPLSGGIRYNGPAEVLWALSGIARQQLSGPIAIGADFGGRLDQPTLTGVIRADNLRYENETYGTVLSAMKIDGRFTQSRFELASLTARAGTGAISASGNVGLDAAGGFPIDVKVTLDRARLARGDDIDATISGSLAITNSKAAGGLIKGDLNIPEARYQIVLQSAGVVPELTGVRRKGAAPGQTVAGETLPSNWKLDIRLRADNRIFVSGMGLEAEWKTDMRIGGTSNAPSVVGRLETVRGTYSFAGRRFDIDHGYVTFQGGLFNPELDISASTTVDAVSAVINITGTAQRPQIAFTSTPALPQDEVLSRLLFGSSVTSLSPTQAIQLAAALNSLRGSGGGLNPLGKLRGAAGIDRLRVLGADESAGRGTALAAGKYISNNIYVEIITDARGFTATQLEISLAKALSVLSQTSSFGGSNVSLRYKKVY